MNIHWLQHVPFEGLGELERFAQNMGAKLSKTALYDPLHSFPTLNSIDFLIIMGGPMSVSDLDQYPWLKAEKEFIKMAVIEAEIPTLGVCLGAQLLAEVLGRKVFKGPKKEIGWFPVKWLPSDLFLKQDTVFQAFHWHGETFTLPDGATLLAESKTYPNQGFLFKNHVLALQFHLETNLESASDLIKHCGHELKEKGQIQSEIEILSESNYFKESNEQLRKLLNAFLESQFEGKI